MKVEIDRNDLANDTVATPSQQTILLHYYYYYCLLGRSQFTLHYWPTWSSLRCRRGYDHQSTKLACGGGDLLSDSCRPPRGFSVDDLLKPDTASDESNGDDNGGINGSGDVIVDINTSTDIVSNKSVENSVEGDNAYSFNPLKSSTSKDCDKSVTEPKSRDLDKSRLPAWVFCTRYSDRPSSGPRIRKPRRSNYRQEQNSKRPRTSFSTSQLKRLSQEFDSNRYLDEQRRKILADDLNLCESQIKIWFQNKRAKTKRACDIHDRLAYQLMAEGLYNHSVQVNSSSTDQNATSEDCDEG